MSPLDHPLLNVVVLLAAIVGNSCFFYVATRVGPLPFLFILLANAAISAPLLLLLCLLQARTAASRQPLLGGEAGRGQTEESLAAMRCLGISRSPRRHATIFLLALLSAGSGVLLVQGGRHTAAALHSLLYQLLIPFNLLFTAALLRRLPARVEFCGALTVCAGVVLALWPLLRSADGYADNSPMGNLLYALGVVPASLHAVLSERVLKAWDLERTHGGPGVLPLAFFVALWALPITLCCVPAYGIADLASLGRLLDEGGRCFLGTVAGCEAAAPAILGAVLTNTLMTVSALRLIASDGAISFSVVCALALPLSTIALNLVAEHATHRPPNWNAHLFAGLAVIVLGNLTYRKMLPRPLLRGPE